MKKTVNSLFAVARRRYGQRGSALLVSLMVMVGLSLLGLSFVAISETESAISAHERDSDQTLAVAETGARMVVEWFQDPTWAKGNSFLPQNLTTLKTQRVLVSQGNNYTGYYKAPIGGVTFDLFDRPFGALNDRFFGTETKPDIIINYTTADGLAFLNTLNLAMFSTSTNVAGGSPEGTEGGGTRITDIRVYAPPIIGGNLNANGFWDDVGLPYGLATIKVTAQKFGPNDIKRTDLSQGKPISTRYTKIVVAPWPFPGPQGPIQSNANISTGGAVGVHWGRMTSEGTMYIKNPYTSLNWIDAWDRPHFEHGYDSSDPWQAGHLYSVGETVHPTAGWQTTAYSYECTTAGGSAGAGSEPNWVANAGTGTATITDSTVVWTRRPTKAWPNNSTYNPPQIEQYNWLYQLINKEYQDVWFEARSRGHLINAQNAGQAGFQPYPYDDPAKDPVGAPDAGYSCWFQDQTQSDPRPNSHRKSVVFPRIDYNFWKDIAVSGSGTQGVYYLQWVSGASFTNGVTTKTFAQWVNTVNDGVPGFYFFDTQNKQNPQGAGAAGIMTPDIALNSGADGHIFQMAGFIYLNCGFGTEGLDGPDGYQNYPGEPYRDVGFRQASETTDTINTPNQTRGQFLLDSSNAPTVGFAGNGNWDFQDLDWSNTAKEPLADGVAATGTRNGKFDVYVRQRTVHLADGTTQSLWLPVEWYPGCHPGDNQTLGNDAKGCSEPHEPYLNLQYYQNGTISRALSSPANPQSIVVGWYPGGSDVFLAKKLTGSPAVPMTCNFAETNDFWQGCTSNAYDRDGPLVDDMKPVLNGVLYMQGDMKSQGNANYYGSVLINGSVDDHGTPDVWFDENLIKNTWPPASMKFPRVYVSSIQTDQQ